MMQKGSLQKRGAKKGPPLYISINVSLQRVGYIALLGIPVDGKLPCQKKSQDKKVKFEEKQNQKDRGNWLPGM